MRTFLPQFTYQTVEWSRQVASIRPQLVSPSHYVLPDLPDVITPDLRQDFYEATLVENRIVTVQVSRHSEATLCDFIQQHINHVNKFLIVGGNTKINSSLSTVEALQLSKILINNGNNQLWAVANPNDPNSVESVHEKLEAGASGIITQPLLSSKAFSTLERYPRSTDSSVCYLAGLALPSSLRGLLFWLNLLEQPELVDDKLFREHVRYFEQNGASPLQWAQEQQSFLFDSHDLLDGIHYMPITNKNHLLSLLATKQ